MKKLLSIIASLILLTSFTACAKKSAASDGKVKVVATIFPLYDWARNIAEGSDNISLELLVKNGVDLHSFQPSASDIIKLSTADVIVYVGGESDSWVTEALKNASNKNQVVINLMNTLSDNIKQEEIVEGMQAETEEEAENDEHIWLSLVNAKLSCQEIASVFSLKDSTNDSLYKANLSDYTSKIDGVFASCVSRDRKLIVVCDRFPFRYMTDELGVMYYAAFAGCSAETEASFETVAFLSNKIKELELNKVYVSESSDKKIARTVIKNAGFSEDQVAVYVLDSMQSVTLDQAKAGKNYIDTMKKNFQLLSEANR